MSNPTVRAPFHVLTKPIGPICNLRCDYCFYLEKTDLFQEASTRDYRMSDEVLEAFTRQYIEAQHPDAEEVNFAWQGGEPTLMGVDFFRRAVAYQQQYARPGQKVTNALQTNATLLNDRWGAFMHEHGFLAGLSVDGPEELHNRFRRDRRGRGSFAATMRGVEAMKRNRVEYNTLTVVQRDNAEHPREVYRFLRDLGSEYLQFIPLVEPGEDGCISPRTVQPQQWGRFLLEVLDEWLKHDIGRVYVQHFELMLGVAMGLPPSLCVHSRTCGRSVALEHNGNLYSCDHFVFPRYYLGNILETHLRDLVDSEQQTTFGNDKFDTLPAYCRRCEFLAACHGGCPGHRRKRTPDGEQGLNWLCEGYREFYTHSAKYFRAMAEALRQRRPAAEYKRFLTAPAAAGAVGRNDPCPCGSGRKYKKCCGRSRS